MVWGVWGHCGPLHNRTLILSFEFHHPVNDMVMRDADGVRERHPAREPETRSSITAEPLSTGPDQLELANGLHVWERLKRLDLAPTWFRQGRGPSHSGPEKGGCAGRRRGSVRA